MSVRQDILELLHSPRTFADGVPADQAPLWLAGLEQFARPRLVPPRHPLRAAQEQAWRDTAGQRLALVLGPPGTGKTHLLAWMAAGYLWACQSHGRSCRVLATGFTREAIANLLEDLVEIVAQDLPGIPVLYLGNLPEQALPAGVEALGLGSNEVESARQRLAAPHLVAGATTWSLYKLFEGGRGPQGDGPTARVFDLVLIDEASQMLVSQGLMALSGLAEGGRVVVAGDDRQLPPVRPTHDAGSEGGRLLGGSLYSFLKSGQVSECRLNETFRLNAPLTEPPAQQFYDGDYRSAVPERRLELQPHWEQGLRPWERTALDPTYPVCILLHEGPPAGTENPFERHVLRHLFQLLRDRLPPGRNEAQLGAVTLWRQRLAIITPHRAQNAALRDALEGEPLHEQAVVETVDRIQGRERDAILAGYTVADAEFALLEAPFLLSAERLNVTVTRARSKLILLVSRRLLEVIPPDEELFEAADQLREYVLSSQRVDTISLPWHGGPAVAVEVRVRQFDESLPLPELQEPIPPPLPPPPALTAGEQQLLEAIRAVAAQSPYKVKNAANFKVGQYLGRHVRFSEFLRLVQAGHINAHWQAEARTPFWTFRPLDPPRPPLSPDLDTARRHLRSVLLQVHAEPRGTYRDESLGRSQAYYDAARDHFLWFDAAGNDLFRSTATQLAAEGLCNFGTGADSRETFDLVEMFTPRSAARDPDDPGGLRLEDFRLLNALEDREKALINFGVYETRVPVAELAAELHLDAVEVEEALGRLEANQYLLRPEAGVVRSRMSEIARELKTVKQRFEQADADARPFQVRALRVEILNRDKPQRNQPLRRVVEELEQSLADVPEAAEVLAVLEPVLRAHWGIPAGEPVQLAAFQAESLRRLVPAYLEVSRDDTFVITADTGSGKTEAACLPLILGAAIDVRRGRRGTRAILVYPRIRLVYNQAQRLVTYLAALARQRAPLLTLGVQTGDVPTRYGEAHYAEVWKPRPEGGYRFPFFGCPAPECGRELALLPDQGQDGADRLECSCGWHYDGYVGTKAGLMARPPDFFLPVTESLHNWLNYHCYGPLWGDGDSHLPPRAVLVDEIHLYSLVQGAQVGYLLRRLLARAYYNARQRDPAAPMPLAIGMSATLGAPRTVWATLTGRRAVVPISARGAGAIGGQDQDPRGREYFYLIQPEVESRGHDVPGASATIQALLCLAHNLRRRPADRGGFRGLVFFDSLDRLKRLHSDFLDAEGNQHLAHLRTCLYEPDPLTGAPRTECCRQPDTCAAFRSGECWYFAATDPSQVTARGPYAPERSLTVLPRPIFSGARGRVDEEIGRSDLVFTTSSLEVGFDDPAMILVYQHYAPVNLASFIQRKGRGGRATSDRPVTGVTLSVYSPRDTWYFRHPEELLRPATFESPLNMDNYFVRRGQAAAALLDAVSRRAFRTGTPLPRSVRGLRLVERLLDDREVDELVRLALGPSIYQDLGVGGVRELWRAVLAARVPHPQPGAPPTWSDFLTWVPGALFDPINLPLLEVRWPAEQSRDPGSKQEEIALAFGECAPGNATRRYGSRAVHWLYPHDPGDGPMLAHEEYEKGRHTFEDLVTAERAELGRAAEQIDARIRAQLPAEVRPQLQRLIDHRLFRPLRLPLTEVGRFRGRSWEPACFWDPQRRILLSKPADEAQAAGLGGVDHRSRSRLRGFLVLHADPNPPAVERFSGLARLAERILVYTAEDGERRGTGLRIDRVFWGVDVRLHLTNREEENWTRVFTSRNGQRTLLHGYRLHTEGVRLTPDSRRLDAFLDAQEGELQREGWRSRWLHGQFFRYLLASRFAGRGLSSYAAGPIADLLVAANSDPTLRSRLSGQRQHFDPSAMGDLLRDAFRRHLHQHPLLTERRLPRHAEELGKAAFAEVFAQSLADVEDSTAFRRYLRSLVLHGLLLSLHELFVLHARGDERRVLMHARLPIQFPEDADDTLSVFESGDHGDGSTRTFRKYVGHAFASWRRGELADCPHAAEDALLDLLFTQEGRHADWRQRDLRDPGTLEGIGRELFGTDAFDRSLLAPLARVLFGSERVGAQRVVLYDLHRDIRGVRRELEARVQRPLMTWELVSAAAERAESGHATTPHLAAWLRAYRTLRRDVDEESHDPLRRLADQVYRLSAALCVDGCRGCLHRDSSLMPEEQVALSVSRDLLQRYREFVLAPLTLRVGEGDGPPTAAAVEERVRGQGLCRLLVAPARYDGLRGSLEALGFPVGRFDPLLRQVVCCREDGPRRARP